MHYDDYCSDGAEKLKRNFLPLPSFATGEDDVSCDHMERFTAFLASCCCKTASTWQRIGYFLLHFKEVYLARMLLVQRIHKHLV
jgi:hypothetical protein